MSGGVPSFQVNAGEVKHGQVQSGSKQPKGRLADRFVLPLNPKDFGGSPFTLIAVQAAIGASNAIALKEEAEPRRKGLVSKIDFNDPEKWLADYKTTYLESCCQLFILNHIQGQIVYEEGFDKMRDASLDYNSKACQAFEDFARRFNLGESLPMECPSPKIPESILSPEDIALAPDMDLLGYAHKNWRNPKLQTRLAIKARQKNNIQIANALLHRVGGFYAQAKFAKFCEKQGQLLENLSEEELLAALAKFQEAGELKVGAYVDAIKKEQDQDDGGAVVADDSLAPKEKGPIQDGKIDVLEVVEKKPAPKKKRKKKKTQNPPTATPVAEAAPAPPQRPVNQAIPISAERKKLIQALTSSVKKKLIPRVHARVIRWETTDIELIKKFNEKGDNYAHLTPNALREQRENHYLPAAQKLLSLPKEILDKYAFDRTFKKFSKKAGGVTVQHEYTFIDQKIVQGRPMEEGALCIVVGSDREIYHVHFNKTDNLVSALAQKSIPTSLGPNKVEEGFQFAGNFHLEVDEQEAILVNVGNEKDPMPVMHRLLRSG